jgi:hypothetical protein
MARTSGRRVAQATLLILVLGLLGLPTLAQAAPRAKPTVVLVKEFEGNIPLDSRATVDAQCPAGYEVLGGSFSIGGNSFFAHAAYAAPIPHRAVYRVTVTNPFVNPFAAIPASEANVTVGAICAVSGKPVVVDGPFDSAERHKRGHRADTVKSRYGVQKGIENNSVTAVEAKCPKGSSVFGGGYATGGSPWTHTSAVVVGSRSNSFLVDLVHPPFDPTLGILRQNAGMRVLALCADKGEPLVLNSDKPGGGHQRARAANKPKRRPHGTLILVKERLDGIENGEVESVEARCPRGYSVIGGSETVDGSALAATTEAAVLSKLNAYRATVANPPESINAGIPKSTAGVLVGAMCAKRGKPIVVDGAFPSR